MLVKCSQWVQRRAEKTVGCECIHPGSSLFNRNELLRLFGAAPLELKVAIKHVNCE